MMADDNWLVDHTVIGVADVAASACFYDAVLGALGARALVHINAKKEPIDPKGAGLSGLAYGVDYPVFWIDVFHPAGAKQHVAFRAGSREAVQAFHEAGLIAGGRDNGKPGIREGGYPPGYYAAFLFDLDGNNVEAVFREN